MIDNDSQSQNFEDKKKMESEYDRWEKKTKQAIHFQETEQLPGYKTLIIT